LKHLKPVTNAGLYPPQPGPSQEPQLKPRYPCHEEHMCSTLPWFVELVANDSWVIHPKSSQNRPWRPDQFGGWKVRKCTASAVSTHFLVRSPTHCGRVNMSKHILAELQ
jgi:hypothetical protein